MSRSCGDCTKCCEGWLHANIRGHYMGETEDPYKPIPCFFVEQGVGCKKYKKRPKDPCKTFECEWVKNENLPEEAKPNISNIIPVLRKTLNNIPYLFLIECGKKMDSEALSWYISDCMSKQINLAWKINGKMMWIGSFEFNKELSRPNA